MKLNEKLTQNWDMQMKKTFLELPFFSIRFALPSTLVPPARPVPWLFITCERGRGQTVSPKARDS